MLEYDIYLSLSDLLQSVLIGSRFIHLIRTDSNTFLFMAEMLKLKLQYFGDLMRRVDSLEKTLMLGGIRGRRRRG